MKFLRSSGAFRALSYPDYFWFWSSYFVSNVGSWMQSIAQGWLLFELTSSPLYLGLFSSLRMVMLLSFFILGGIMSDRIDRRKIMFAIQVISALTALGLALLVSTHTIQVWHIFVLGAITSTTWAFEQPVRQALLPQLVPARRPGKCAGAERDHLERRRLVGTEPGGLIDRAHRHRRLLLC